MRWSEIYEEGAVGVVANNKKQAKDPRYSMSMTNDVKPGETQRQAAKFGNKLDKKGHPPTLSKKVKGASTNVAFNLGLSESRIKQLEASYEGNIGIMELIKFYQTAPAELVAKVKELINQKKDKEVWRIVQKYTNTKLKGKEFDVDERLSLKSKAYKKSLGAAKASGRRRKRKLTTKFSEGYKLQLERDPNMYVLHITDTASGKRTEVRGKSGYESGNYDANDKLHQLLDKVGKSANVSELINGEVVSINPKHPDADRAKAATDVAYNEEFDNIQKIDLENALDRMAEIAVNGDRLKDVFIMRNQHNMTFKQIGDEIGTKTDRARQVYLRSLRYLKKILQDYNVEENFADGKKKGKSRPGRVKKSGASCKGSVTKLRKQAKKASGERAKMYHWCANMKAGRKK